MIDAIRVERISKTFRFPTVPRRATLKDLVIRSLRFERSETTVEALSNVTFAIEGGSTLGIIGRNGSGKTTLMRILAGILHPDDGDLHIEGTLAPLLALGVGFHPDLTGREGVRIELLSLGLNRAEVAALIGDIVSFAEIGDFVDAPVRTYSTGMIMRLAFAVAICVDPDVLLLDEVLAVGDEAFAQKCLECIDRFRKNGKTIALVTHNSAIVETWCDVALWLDKGRVAAFGDPKAVVSAYHALTDATASAL